VVIGKHQIAVKEINPYYTYTNNIHISRRLSGGGAVYHDDGNLNFSFIRTTKNNESISYQVLTEPLYDFLKSLGINVTLNSRNDFLLEEKKVSGSAMHVYKERIMAHCTLLVNSNLKNLSQSLQSHPERFTDKSIQSVRSRVINLSEFYGNITIDDMLDQLSRYFLSEKTGNKTISLDKESYNTINQLAKDKYSTNDWIYGYSPKYTYQNSLMVNQQEIKFILSVEKGIINNVEIKSENEINNIIRFLINNLNGIGHSYNAIYKILENSPEPGLKDTILDALI
jgi:lipoate-protein ligase A